MTRGPIVERGSAEVARTLRKAGVSLDDLKDANQRTGDIVAGSARVTAPRRSGRLRSSIRSARQARRVRVTAGGARVPYAAVIHWGWPRRHIAPQRFVIDAARRTRRRWLAEYDRAVEAELRKVKGA